VPATHRVVLATGELHAALTGPTGLVTRYVLRKTSDIRNRAVLYCPVDTGHLRNSITEAVRTDGQRVIGTVGTNVVYSLPVHEGRTTSRGRHIPGRPFLRKALDDIMART
jgi:phage gpG-like protein